MPLSRFLSDYSICVFHFPRSALWFVTVCYQDRKLILVRLILALSNPYPHSLTVCGELGAVAPVVVSAIWEAEAGASLERRSGRLAWIAQRDSVLERREGSRALLVLLRGICDSPTSSRGQCTHRHNTGNNPEFSVHSSLCVCVHPEFTCPWYMFSGAY